MGFARIIVDCDGIKGKLTLLPKDCILMVGAMVLVVKLGAIELFLEDPETLTKAGLRDILVPAEQATLKRRKSRKRPTAWPQVCDELLRNLGTCPGCVLGAADIASANRVRRPWNSDSSPNPSASAGRLRNGASQEWKKRGPWPP